MCNCDRALGAASFIGSVAFIHRCSVRQERKRNFRNDVILEAFRLYILCVWAMVTVLKKDNMHDIRFR